MPSFIRCGEPIGIGGSESAPLLPSHTTRTCGSASGGSEVDGVCLGVRWCESPLTLRRCAGHSGLHPSIRARAPVPRTSAAWRLRDARSTHLPSVWPFVFSTLLRPLLTSRADSASSPFQAQGEISPDKSPDLRCTTAGSTPSPLGHWSFAVIGPLALDDTASYPVSVRRLAGSFPTSFPRSVALAQLWFPSLRVASSGEDLHLLVSTHAGRTKTN